MADKDAGQRCHAHFRGNTALHAWDGIGPMDPLFQWQLLQVLQYFRRGSFAEFRRACDVVIEHQQVQRAQYLHSDLLLAAVTIGLIEVSLFTGSIRWWTAHDSDTLRIDSANPKELGFTHEW